MTEKRMQVLNIQNNIMKTALENIAGTRPMVNNNLSDKTIATIALDRVAVLESNLKQFEGQEDWNTFKTDLHHALKRGLDLSGQDTP